MNQFLFDHQIAAMKVDRSLSPEERVEALAQLKNRAARITRWRKANGLSELAWLNDRETVNSGKGGQDA
ncbi:hypothetical protein [Aurantiacibacter gangjinensis]|uniref:Uncharacterized protein n=1 Tax=Aurantiacibacter gangjinensis TaxID=502682 RepID=A0A0G9MNJ3_9SPHN|nr:hypothetical protein [Aurantiacibacter gangjinensis]KLE32275.1 hypothetical protein AAW01_10450 [Aurantiacibacter gangjinensis]